MLYCCLRYLKCSVNFATGLKFTALLGMLASAGDSGWSWWWEISLEVLVGGGGSYGI